MHYKGHVLVDKIKSKEYTIPFSTKVVLKKQESGDIQG